MAPAEIQLVPTVCCDLQSHNAMPRSNSASARVTPGDAQLLTGLSAHRPRPISCSALCSSGCSEVVLHLGNVEVAEDVCALSVSLSPVSPSCVGRSDSRSV
ncbi:hypothetical protein GJAV_G00271150 [Gymnothorax javanicus]|nr:hypothetical protein GJAV_G00271150 [Gymnothorax javanicus]